MLLTGRLRSLYLFDVCEELSLNRAQRILGLPPAESLIPSPRPGPDFVRFERPPLIEPLAGGAIKYYDYGVVSYEIDEPFCGDWKALVAETSRRVLDPAGEEKALAAIRPHVDRIQAALSKPYRVWLSEDYHFVTVTPGELGTQDLLTKYGSEIAQIVRGEALPLSDTERQEVLQASISYYPNDLLVVGWSAAFVYDTPPPPVRRCNSWNTPTRNCSNFAITTTC